MDGEPTDYVLDCFAMFAYFWNEPGGTKVKLLLEKAQRNEITLHLSLIYLGELYYMTCKKVNKPDAESIVTDTRRLPIQIVSVTDSQIWEAVKLKANHNISFADAFAASLALSLDVPVVTGDPEFRDIGNKIKVYWILDKANP